MKIAIVYYSKHHNNTKKLIDAIAEKYDADLYDVTNTKSADLSEYDLIGFASGIYYQTYQKSVLSFAEKNLPEGKKVFFLYTCGIKRKNYTKDIADVAKSKNAIVCGSFGCKGYDTFGPFKIVGGIAKKHPDEEDIVACLKFFDGIVAGSEERK